MALISICGEESSEAMWDNSSLCQTFSSLTSRRYTVPYRFQQGPLTASVASHAASKAESLLAFMYSLRTQSKRQKLCQPGISGKQVSSHFILYKSKHTPGLGLRTMPLEWAAIHVAAQCKCRVCDGARSHVHLERAYTCGNLYVVARVCQM